MSASFLEDTRFGLGGSKGNQYKSQICFGLTPIKPEKENIILKKEEEEKTKDLIAAPEQSLARQRERESERERAQT